MACNDRQLSQAQREAGFTQQRTGVPLAVRPFSGPSTIENLVDYLNRELVPGVRSARAAINDVFLQVADNAPSANPLAFYFATATAAADPTVGRIRLNAATQNTASIIRVSQSNGRLVDVTPWLDVMSGGPTTPLGTVTLMDAINPSRFLRWDLNTMTDQGAYWDLGVTFIEGSDADPFVEGEAVTLGFISGVSAAGSTVPVGSLSPVANDTFLGNVSGGAAAPSAVNLSTLAGAGLAFAVHTLDVTGSTSITVTSDQVQRAALSGAIAAAANTNATLFAGIRDNGNAETDRTNLNFVSTTGASITVAVTDDAGNDELEVSATYVGSTTNVNLQSLTGAQGVVDISTLLCGGSVTVESVSADYTVAGFTAKTDGFWFWFIDRRQSGATNGSFLEDSGSTTTSIRNHNEVETAIPFAGRAQLYYFNGRWRVLSGGPGAGRLLRAGLWAPSTTFLTETRYYLAAINGGGGGGGGANSAAVQGAAGGGGGGGGFGLFDGTDTTGQSLTLGTQGSAGSSAGGNGGAGGSTTFTVSAGSHVVGGGAGGIGSTAGSGSGVVPARSLGGAGASSSSGSFLRLSDGGDGGVGLVLSGTLAVAGIGGAAGDGTPWSSNTGNLGVGGGGGESTNNSDQAGLAGGPGSCFVWEFS